MVNLTGKLVDCPPTKANIATLISSRVDATRVLVEATATRPVRRWLQASTTAGYAEMGDERIDENTTLRTDPALALTGRHCTSEVLDDVGFAFRYPKLPEALEQIAG